MIKGRAIVLFGCLVTTACALSFLSATEPEKENPKGAETAPAKPPTKEIVKLPQTVEELDALIRRLDEVGRMTDADSTSSGIGPMLGILGQVKDPKFTGVLADHLSKTSSWKVKAGCILGLANITTRESTDALAKFLKSAPELTGMDRVALQRNGINTQVDQWMYSGCIKAAAKSLAQRGQVQLAKEDFKRFRLIEELAAGGKPGLEVIIELSRAMKSGKEADTYPVQLTSAIAAIRAPDCLELLRGAAIEEDLPDGVRQGAVQALAEGWGADEYQTIIVVARTAKYTGLRSDAYRYAAKLKPQLTADELIPLLKDSVAELRGTAAYLLGTIGDPRVIPNLVELLDDEKDEVRLQALAGLWLLDHSKRMVKWNAPKFDKEYQQWMDSHPKDK